MPPKHFYNLIESMPRCNEAVFMANSGPKLTRCIFPFNLLCIYVHIYSVVTLLATSTMYLHVLLVLFLE